MWPDLRKPAILSKRAYGAMRVFSATGKKSQSPVFVIFMSENLSIILCRHLRRVNVGYKAKYAFISIYLVYTAAVHGTRC